MQDDTAPSPFSIPLYRRIWAANVTSQFGALIQSVGAAWLMLELGGTKTQVALVQASVTLPIMILALLSGAIADNFPRRLVMLACQAWMFVLSVILCVFAWMGSLTPWALLGFTFLIGCGTAMNAPSWQATVGDIVPRGTIPRAVAMNSMGFNIARTAGPALGGAIVAAVGAAAAFTVNAFSYVGIIWVLATWRPEDTAKPTLKEDLGQAMWAGLRYVALSPQIRRVLFRSALFGIASAGVPSLLPLVASHLVGGSAITFGLLSGSFGVGAVSGALSNRAVRARLSTEHTLRLTVCIMILGAVIIALSPWVVLTVLGLVLYGWGWLLSMATMNVTVQMSAPRWVVGRALSLYQMCVFGTMALGSWASGRLSEHYGIGEAILVMGGLLGIGLVAGFFLPLPEVDDLNLEPTGRWRVPDVKVPVEARNGPVHIAVHYRIAEKDMSRFLAAMNESRRVRLRDGAWQWALARDLSDPDVWIEKFRFSRWMDYVLHNERRTHTDSENLKLIQSLHRGDWPPHIARLLERQVTGVTINPELSADTTNDPTKEQS
ncbi:MAG: MFS transporter [Hyphomonas sp.]|uniref:MFS transporter n=1 Tax=Hyphomonas sp. TaxID=87 RepID=UPI003527025F